MTLVIRIGKKAKAALKKAIKGEQRAHLSQVRRIERVRAARRVVAMTFDDGPCNLPANPDRWEGRALTDVLLDTLAEFGAKGTFDVVGDTSDNYPDEKGAEGGPQWGGVKFDHYPDFGQDAEGGAVAQRELARRILAEGHELTNHGYAHRLFGRQAIVYGKRQSFCGLREVVEDLEKLHRFVREEFSYEMKLARPPHYVDRIGGGLTSYDAYAVLGYQYMAASFDGAGWLPCASGYDDEVEAMVRPLREALERDPDALAGQIIFQKDGFNMARRSPVADGLRRQLELLRKYGYEVVTVSQLLAISPAADVEPEGELAGAVSDLLALGHPVLFSDNTFRADAPLTRGELAMMLSDRSDALRRIALLEKGKKGKIFPDLPVGHPYSMAIKRAVEKGYMTLENGRFHPERKLTAPEFDQALRQLCAHGSPFPGAPTREEAALLLSKIFVRLAARKKEHRQ